MSPIRLGIIGYGIMGERLLRAALNHDPAVVAVAGLWDPSTAAMQRLAKDLPQVPQLDSAVAVIAACDCLNIARSEEHTSELQSLMRISYAVLCLKKTNKSKKQS